MSKDKRKKIVLLDAHAILHRAYHALPDFATSSGKPTGALYGIAAMLIKIIGELKPDYLFACYDLPGPTYRHEAYDEYKSQRKKPDEELVSQMESSKDIFKAFSIPIYSVAGFEADDVLGTIVEKLKGKKDIQTIIASGDMDTLQLVSGDQVVVYTLRKGISDTILYNEEKVVERFGFKPDLLPDYKGLRGDPSDNIVGIKGVGEKTATTLVSNIGSIEKIYKTLSSNEEKIKEAGLTDRQIKLIREGEEEAEFSKMLATIRRDAPLDFVIPEKKWIETVSIDKAEELFKELEFRTLGSRLKNLISQNGGDVHKAEYDEEESPVKKDLTEEEIKETAVALWVLDSNITNPKEEDILKYANTKSLKEAKDKIFSEIKKEDKAKVFENIEKPLIPVVQKMMDRGIKIDKDYLTKLSKEYHKELKERERKIWKATGFEFNINSPKQLAEVIFDNLQLGKGSRKKTSTGAKSTKESVLQDIKDEHPSIPLILEYREFQKLLSTYIDAIPSLLDKENRLHADIIQTGTTTGRMSSSNPNVQNIPIKTSLGRAIRKAFIPKEGFKLVAIDYSQIELRIAAILSGDEKLLSTFQNNEDIHTAVAAYMFKIPKEEVDKETRRNAKTINFGILYGMGVNALKSNLGTTRKEAQRFYNTYFETFEGLTKYIEKIKKDSAEKGYTETLFGRKRYIKGINSKIPFIRSAAERMAVNAPFQGTSADIIKIAMRRIDDYLKEKGFEKDACLILQVHDELIYEIKERLVEKIAPEIKKIMEGVLVGEKARGVVCRADASVGYNWDELSPLN